MRKKTVHILSMALAMVLVFAAVSALCGSAFAASGPLKLQQIATGGNGDAMNNYAWSVYEYKNALYVGTGRNILYQVGVTFKALGILPAALTLESATHPGGTIGSQEWAEDMSAEIWRYKNKTWTRVYQSDVVSISGGAVKVPRVSGFREMLDFTDKNGETALYASNGAQLAAYTDGVSLLLKSVDGANWSVVSTPALGTDSRSMTVHNGYLCVGLSYAMGGSHAQIWASNAPGSDPGTWHQIADFTADGNTAVASMTTYNGYLYAGTLNRTDGYQVWKGEFDNSDPPNVTWTKVVENGAGDKANIFAGTMKVFKKYLYVGSMSLPVVNGTYVPKGFELIRIDAKDEYQLLVGDVKPLLPPSDDETPRVPRSGWPGGFANPLNLYCWSLQEYNGTLFLGTFDSSIVVVELIKQGLASQELGAPLLATLKTALKSILAEAKKFGLSKYDTSLKKVLAAYNSKTTLATILDVIAAHFCGGDLWRSNNGVTWIPVSINGLGNPHNYGIRELVLGTKNRLYIGTANPFDGFDVFVGKSK